MRHTLKNGLLDKYGKPIVKASSTKQMAFGQYNSIYEYPNYGRFRWRTYVNQDTELGASMLTRDLLVRWSRELINQEPWMYAAVKIFAQFVVGREYKVLYTGEISNWWNDEAYPYLCDYYLPNCCVRGGTYDFNTAMFVACKILSQDGDFGSLFNENGQFQFIPCHRIGSSQNLRISANDKPVMAGPLPNTIISDGVIYDSQSRPLGYSVINTNNMVNSLMGVQDTTYYSARDMELIYDPDYMDRGRGFPQFSAGLLQAMSLQEIESYMFEGIKIQRMVALVEKTPGGEGPEVEAMDSERLMAIEGNNLNIPHNTPGTGIKLVDGPDWKYVTVNGGDIKPLAVDAIAGESLQYIDKIQSEVLMSGGIPHELLLSADDMSGRMSDGICKIFNSTVAHRQKILDKFGRKIIIQALAKAMERGDIAPNYGENLYEAIDFSHPTALSLNDSYDRKDALTYYQAGMCSMNDITLKSSGKTAEETMSEIAEEVKTRYAIANQTAKEIKEITKQDISADAISNEIKGHFEANLPQPQPDESEEKKEAA